MHSHSGVASQDLGDYHHFLPNPLFSEVLYFHSPVGTLPLSTADLPKSIFLSTELPALSLGLLLTVLPVFVSSSLLATWRLPHLNFLHPVCYQALLVFILKYLLQIRFLLQQSRQTIPSTGHFQRENIDTMDCLRPTDVVGLMERKVWVCLELCRWGKWDSEAELRSKMLKCLLTQSFIL